MSFDPDKEEAAFLVRMHQSRQRASVRRMIANFEGDLRRADEHDAQIKALRAELAQKERALEAIPRAAVTRKAQVHALEQLRQRLTMTERDRPSLQLLRDAAQRRLPELKKQLVAMEA